MNAGSTGLPSCRGFGAVPARRLIPRPSPIPPNSLSVHQTTRRISLPATACWLAVHEPARNPLLPVSCWREVLQAAYSIRRLLPANLEERSVSSLPSSELLLWLLWIVLRVPPLPVSTDIPCAGSGLSKCGKRHSTANFVPCSILAPEI